MQVFKSMGGNGLLFIDLKIFIVIEMYVPNFLADFIVLGNFCFDLIL